MIPVFEPDFGDEEIAAVVAALKRGEISGSFGRAIPEFEAAFAGYIGSKYGVAVTSGTTALHLAVAALELPAGSEVLMSASTNVATALAAFHNGLVPVGVDSEDVSWNLDLDLLEGLITPRTRAIIPVHLFGHPVDMDRLVAICRKHSLRIIEDCAESHGATVRGRMTGTFGDAGCFSFYANKIITTGEGGMILTDDDELAQRLRLLRNLAFTTPRFRHDAAGFNFRMTGIQAAFGTVQVRKIEKVIEAKRAMAAAYGRHLKGLPGLQLPSEAEWARHVYWMYGVVVRPEFGIGRDELATRLHRAGVDTRTFFCPVNAQPFLQATKDFPKVPTPVADRLWRDGLYLPSSHTLGEPEIRRVAEAIAAARQDQ